LSISDGLPVSIEAVLEGVNRGGVDDMLRKTVPRTDDCDDTLTEEVFPEIKKSRRDLLKDSLRSQDLQD